MITEPYWLSAPVPRFPKLDRNLTVDVVVIGGGITGITTAYLLRKAGATVALLERDRFAEADTGHTTAHLTYVTDLRLSELVNKFGRDHAQAVWHAGQAAIEQIAELVEKEGIACDFSWVPGFLHAPLDGDDGKEADRLQEDAKLAAELGFDVEYLADTPFMKRPGIRFSDQAKFHPRKYLAGLLESLNRDRGCHLFQESDVQEFTEEPLAVKANGFTVQCKYVVVATHVPLHGLTGTVSAALFQTKLAPYLTYAVGAKVPAGAAPEASFWDTADPYWYLRIDRQEGHDYAILGGADQKTAQGRAPEESFAEVERQMRRLFPTAELEHRWSGQVIETHDGLPFIGERVEKQFVATGFAGNGTTFGTLSAMMARDAFTKRRNPWSELFDVHRKKVLGGAWDYLRENKDFPFYLLKNWLAKPDTESLREVKNGEGKILMLDGAKMAAYRDDAGQLTMRSAVCTHMGCIVRWNGAEKTWDCPCHGSRFKTTGDVLAGPAETPLEEGAS